MRSDRNLKLDVLFTIGGDGTQRGGNALFQEARKRGHALSVVGIPKTVDNDVAFVARTFGYLTAVQEQFHALEPAIPILVQRPGMSEPEREAFLAVAHQDRIAGAPDPGLLEHVHRHPAVPPSHIGRQLVFQRDIFQCLSRPGRKEIDDRPPLRTDAHGPILAGAKAEDLVDRPLRHGAKNVRHVRTVGPERQGGLMAEEDHQAQQQALVGDEEGERRLRIPGIRREELVDLQERAGLPGDAPCPVG